MKRAIMIFPAIILLCHSCSHLGKELAYSDAAENSPLEFSIIPDAGIEFRDNEHGKSSAESDESMITDVNMAIYDSKGNLYANFYGSRPTAMLYKGHTYNIYVLCNYGKPIIFPSDMHAVDDMLLDFSISSVSANGIPMAGYTSFVPQEGTRFLGIKVIRLLSKIGVRIDKSKLSEAEYTLKGAHIRCCPTRIRPWKEGYAQESTADGDYASEHDMILMNNQEEVFFYVPESCAGTSVISEPSQRIRENAPMNGNIPYLEVEASYSNHGLVSENVLFRIYLGTDNSGDFNLYRNYRYHYSLALSDYGLLNPCFRVDAGDISSTRSISWSVDSLFVTGGTGTSVAYNVIPSDLPVTLTSPNDWSKIGYWKKSDGNTVHISFNHDNGERHELSITASAGIPGKTGYVSSTLPITADDRSFKEYQDPELSFTLFNDVDPWGGVFYPELQNIKVTQLIRSVYHGRVGNWTKTILGSPTILYGKNPLEMTTEVPEYVIASAETTVCPRTLMDNVYVKAIGNGGKESATMELGIFRMENKVRFTIGSLSTVISIGQTISLKPTLTYSSRESIALQDSVDYIIKNNEICTIENNMVKGISNGSTTITGYYNFHSDTGEDKQLSAYTYITVK